MEIRYRGLQYDLPDAVTHQAKKKLFALKKYLAHQDAVTHVYVELGKETDAHHAGKIWLARINLTHDGQLFRAEALEESVENALDHAISELGSELKKAKQRNESLLRKGGAFLKSFIRRTES